MSDGLRVTGRLRYPEYLRIAELLSLQHPVSRPPHHDETLFIVVHQVFELWFKLLLHDFDELRLRLGGDDVRYAIKLARRTAEVQRALVEQVRLLETMSTLDFLEFRSELEGASGFQSAQFRELETLLGVGEKDRVELGAGSGRPIDAYLALLAPDERERVERRLGEPTVEEAFLEHLDRRVAPAAAGRAYLVDVRDLLAEAGNDTAAARAALARLEERAEVADQRDLAPVLGRLRELPLWLELGAGEREWIAAAAPRARLEEALRKGGLPGQTPACLEAALGELRLLDEELGRRLTLPLAEVEAALAEAGVDSRARPQLAATLERRARLRQVYRREAHGRQGGPGDTYETWLLAEALLDFAEAYHVFRFRHVKMVERMIGSRRGTGGSPGVAYLEKTLRYRVFPELWRVRTYL